jgi:hypothetical protein
MDSMKDVKGKDFQHTQKLYFKQELAGYSNSTTSLVRVDDERIHRLFRTHRERSRLVR